MGVIDDLPDHLLLQILSWLPTREGMATMFLSKRWKFIWKQVPNVDYDSTEYDGKDFSEFVSRSLQLQEAPVFKSFKLSVSPYCDITDVGSWIDFATSRFVSDLELDLSAALNPMITTLPKSLYTCSTVTSLKLKALVLADIPEDYEICLPSLQYFYLSVSVQVSADKFIGTITAGAPVLKKSVVNGPVYNDQFLDSMATYNLLQSFILCSSEWDPSIDSHFDNLENLCMCTCSSSGWWDLLIIFLQRSPKLRYLKLNKSCKRPLLFWNQPISASTTPVPECLSSKLEILEWTDYIETQFNKAVASFLLKNATCLTKATIFPQSTAGPIEKLRVRTDLSRWPRGSPTCQLIFGSHIIN